MKKLQLFFLACCAFMMLTNEDSCNTTTQNIEEQKVEENQKRLTAETDIPVLTRSLERKAISKRLVMFEDENKVSYIYLISFGKVMAFYTIKGKVTSGTKRLTTNQKIVCNDNYQAGNYSVVESPSLDGTYGGSDAYVFFWTTSDVYVQWNGEYMVCDQPLKLSTQPELVQMISNK